MRTKGDSFMMIFTDGSGTLELMLNVPDILSVPPSGPADDAVGLLEEIPYIAKQLDALGHDAMARFLSEYGTWTPEELADVKATRQRVLWLAAAGLREEIWEMDMFSVLTEEVDL